MAVKRYAVKEMFGPTIQGEGRHSGMPVVFLRFAGCNAWSGNPVTKAASLCPFCDTDFYQGTRLTAVEIVRELRHLSRGGTRAVVCSGGEPLLQLDQALTSAILDAGLSIHVETNGMTEPLDASHRKWCWVTCSPKVPPHELVISLDTVDEFKVLWPHPDPRITPKAYDKWLRDHGWGGPRCVQPIEEQGSEDYSWQMSERSNALIELVAGLPGWNISIQLHKVIGAE